MATLENMSAVILKKEDYEILKGSADETFFDNLLNDPNWLCEAAILKDKMIGYCLFEISDDLCDVKELNANEINKNMDVRKFLLENLIKMIEKTDCKVIVCQLYEEEGDLPGQEEMVEALGFHRADTTYFERFTIDQASKDLLLHSDSSSKNIYGMDEVDANSLAKFDRYLKENNLFYNLNRGNILRQYSRLYCPEGKDGEIKGCFLVGNIEGEKRRELSIEFMYLSEDVKAKTSAFAMMVSAVTMLKNDINGKTVVNVYASNSDVQRMLDRIVTKPEEKYAIEECFYINEKALADE